MQEILENKIESSIGIGLGFLTQYVGRDNTTVIAALRSVGNQQEALSKFANVKTGTNSTIVCVAIDVLNPSSAAAAMITLEKDFGINSLDLVIANAGISKAYTTTIDTSIQEFRDHWEVNTLGPLVLFQAAWPLLQRAAQPKFVALSTVFATIGDMGSYQFPNVAYGQSKAAANFIIRKIHFENPGLIAFSVHPGWVQTDQGNHGAKSLGLQQAPLTIQESISGMIGRVSCCSNYSLAYSSPCTQIDQATREETSGTFQGYNGVDVPW